MKRNQYNIPYVRPSNTPYKFTREQNRRYKILIAPDVSSLFKQSETTHIAHLLLKRVIGVLIANYGHGVEISKSTSNVNGLGIFQIDSSSVYMLTNLLDYLRANDYVSVDKHKGSSIHEGVDNGTIYVTLPKLLNLMEPTTDHKLCSSCTKDLPISDFYSKDGMCKSCAKATRQNNRVTPKSERPVKKLKIKTKGKRMETKPRNSAPKLRQIESAIIDGDIVKINVGTGVMTCDLTHFKIWSENLKYGKITITYIFKFPTPTFNVSGADECMLFRDLVLKEKYITYIDKSSLNLCSSNVKRWVKEEKYAGVSKFHNTYRAEIYNPIIKKHEFIGYFPTGKLAGEAYCKRYEELTKDR